MEKFQFIVSSVMMANTLHGNRLIWGMDGDDDVYFRSNGCVISIEGSEQQVRIELGHLINKSKVESEGCVNVERLIKLYRLLKGIPEQPVVISFDGRKDITITCQL